MKCYKCGAEVALGRMSCEKCGAMVFSNRSKETENSQMEYKGSLHKVQQGGGAGFSVASMVLGIISIVLFFTVFVPIPCGIISLALGGYSLYTKRDGRGMAITGLSCSIVALGLVIVIVFLGLAAADNSYYYHSY